MQRKNIETENPLTQLQMKHFDRGTSLQNGILIFII
jgi:hypothetical protein